MTWRGLPVVALTLGALAALMLLPAAFAAIEGDWRSARVFMQCAGLTVALAGALALANRARVVRSPARAELLAVAFVFAVAPAVAAAPVWLLAPRLGPVGAYFEMVSTFTTTGASALPRLESAPRALHLWRGATAWFGGFAALVAAAAVFAPRNLGGFEVQGADRPGPVGRIGGPPAWAGGAGADAGARFAQAVVVVAPVYAALTAALAVGLAASGMGGLRSVVTAMGVMSTSGVAVDGQGFRGGAGIAAEALAAALLLVAASRHVYAGRDARLRLRALRRDPELELAALAVGAAAGWILLKHVAATQEGGVVAFLQAAWASVFTCLSFLTTTGYVAAHWPGQGSLVGYGYPGMILLGLAAVGGGVASTAGGVKLLRAYALFKHGLRDLDALSQPHVVARRGAGARRVGFAGAVLAWLFVMLFALGVTMTAVALAATGLPLDQSVAAAIAAMSNTGPAYVAALGPEATPVAAMGPAAQAALCAAMILGRVEVLAVVALANPDYWRR